MTCWINVRDRLPASGVRVIFSWLNDYHPPKRRTSTGFYASRFSIDASDFPEHEDYEYSEEKDQFFVDVGWYEEGAQGEYFYPQVGVTHWMPLPRPPE